MNPDAIPPVPGDESGSGVEAAATRRRRAGSTFAGDVLRLVSGTTVAQLITVLSSPIVTRLYGPEAFGLWAIFGSITLVIGVVVCLRYELAIMLPPTDEEAANIFTLSLLFVSLTTLITVPLVVFGGGLASRLLKAPALSKVLWAVPVMVFINGVILVFNYWNSRTRHFARLSGARVAASATSTAVQLGAGWSGHAGANSLIASSIAGSGISSAALARQILRDDGALFRRSVRWRAIREAFARYSKFPAYGTASALLNSVSWQLPSFLLQYYFSTLVVGLYSVGNQMLRVPLSLVGGAISQVFYQRAAEAHRKGRLAEIVEGAFQRLVAFGLFPTVIFAIVGREIFLVVLGSKWGEAGVYTQILSLWTFFWFISSPLTSLFSVLERQEFGLKINAVIFVTRLASLVTGGLLGNARLAIMLFAGTGVLTYGYLNFAVMAASGVSYRRALKILWKYVVLTAPAAGILLALKFLGTGLYAPVVAAAILSAAYGLYVARTDPQISSRLARAPWLGRLVARRVS